MLAKTMPDNERRAVLRQLNIIEMFRELRTTMPLQYIHTFLLVASEEGCSVGYYATKAQVSPSVMSRHILDIGERNRDRDPGFGLVQTKPNMENLREHVVFLSPKGKALISRLARQFDH